MRPMNKIGLCLFCCLSGSFLFAHSQEDTLQVYFRRGYAVLEPELRGNRETLEGLVVRLEAFGDDTAGCVSQLSLRGNASPDGTAVANVRLTRKRVEAVLSYLRQRVEIPDGLVEVRANGFDWEGLQLRVEDDPKCPARQEVLEVLSDTPEWMYDAQGRIVDGRRKRLMDLRGGVPYGYLAEKVFPDLRNVSIILYGQGNQLQAQKEAPDPSDGRSQATVVGGGSDTQAVAGPMGEAIPEQTSSGKDPEGVRKEEIAGDTLVQTPWHRLAIKTNLLYDAILMPSLEVEYRIDDRWSVAVEGSVAWWKRDRQHKYYQIATILPEGRYWFGTKKPWHGHYVGVFAGGSWYDLENGERGYKGEFFTTGVSYGYMFPIGRSLSIEAGLGVGFLYTTYEEYLPIDGHYVYQQTSRTNWFGPVKVKLALVWRLWDGKKGGRR